MDHIAKKFRKKDLKKNVCVSFFITIILRHLCLYSMIVRHYHRLQFVLCPDFHPSVLFFLLSFTTNRPKQMAGCSSLSLLSSFLSFCCQVIQITGCLTLTLLGLDPMSVLDEHGCVSLLYKKDLSDLINKLAQCVLNMPSSLIMVQITVNLMYF